MHSLQKARMLLLMLLSVVISNVGADTPWSEHQCQQLQQNLTQLEAQQHQHHCEQLAQARHCGHNVAQVVAVEVLTTPATQSAQVPPLPRPAGLTILGFYLSWDLFEWIAVAALLLIVVLWLTLREQPYYQDKPDDSHDNDAR